MYTELHTVLLAWAQIKDECRSLKHLIFVSQICKADFLGFQLCAATLPTSESTLSPGPQTS